MGESCASLRRDLRTLYSRHQSPPRISVLLAKYPIRNLTKIEMTLLSNSLIAFGLLLLSHAFVPSHSLTSPLVASLRPPHHSCYSAYEHHSLTTSSSFNPPPSSLSSPLVPNANSGLPLDISIETIASVLSICLGLVVGSEELKPISWRVWAGQAEREQGPGGPFGGLEERRGFMDVRVSLLLSCF